MPIQVGKMILWGIITGIFYIAVPLILFGVLEMMGIMVFTQEFKISIIIIGVVGVIFSMLSHAYPKDTSANRIIAFFSTIYSGVFLFYIFGGFTPGLSLGSYSIEIPPFIILFGLQLIAWLLLGSTGIRALQYLVEALELRKKKEYNVRVKKQFRLSRVFKGLGMLMTLVIVGYFGSLIFSGMNLSFAIQPIEPGDISYSDGGTSYPQTSDDDLNITLTFDLDNQGLYAIYNLYIDVIIYTGTTDNASALPYYTKIGESHNIYPTFHSFTPYPNQDILLQIDSIYVYGLATTGANLELHIAFSTLYAGILIDLNATLQTTWYSLF